MDKIYLKYPEGYETVAGVYKIEVLARRLSYPLDRILFLVKDDAWKELWQEDYLLWKKQEWNDLETTSFHLMTWREFLKLEDKKLNSYDTIACDFCEIAPEQVLNKIENFKSESYGFAN